MSLKEADRWFSLAVRTYGHCEACGSTKDLTCSHIIKRRYIYTRWSFRNAHCLCLQCHQFFEMNPRAFKDWVRRTWAGEYMRSENYKNLLKGYKDPVDTKERTRVAKDVYYGRIELLLARIKDL